MLSLKRFISPKNHLFKNYINVSIQFYKPIYRYKFTFIQSNNDLFQSIEQSRKHLNDIKVHLDEDSFQQSISHYLKDNDHYSLRKLLDVKSFNDKHHLSILQYLFHSLLTKSNSVEACDVLKMIIDQYEMIPSNYLCSKLLGLLYDQKKKGLFISMYNMLVYHDFLPTYKVAMNIIPSLVETGDVDGFFNCFMKIPSIRNNINIDDYKKIFMSAALLGRYKEMDIMYLNIDRTKIYENFFVDILEILSSRSKEMYLKWTKHYYTKFPRPTKMNHLKVSLYENRLLYLIEHINEEEINNNFPEIIHFKYIIDDLDESLRFWVLSTLQRFQSIRDLKEYFSYYTNVLPKLLLNFISNVVLEFCRLNDLNNAFKWREIIKNKYLQCDISLLSLCHEKKFIHGVKMYHSSILKNIKDQYLIEKIIKSYTDSDMINEAKEIYFNYSLTIDDHILFDSFIYTCNKIGDFKSVMKEIERRRDNGKKFTSENLNGIIQLLLSYNENEVIQCIETFKNRYKTELSIENIESYIKHSIENKKDELVIFFLKEILKRNKGKESIIYIVFKYLSESYSTAMIIDGLNYFDKKSQRIINFEERNMIIIALEEWCNERKLKV